MAMLTQLEPSALHLCHWYVNEVGLFVHTPLPAVRVFPCWRVPPIVGALVFTGAAADADDAIAPARRVPASATIASRFFIVRSFRFRSRCRIRQRRTPSGF